MARPAFPKSLSEFQVWFDNEEACQRYLVESRWADGYACPRCGHGEAQGEGRLLAIGLRRHEVPSRRSRHGAPVTLVSRVRYDDRIGALAREDPGGFQRVGQVGALSFLQDCDEWKIVAAVGRSRQKKKSTRKTPVLRDPQNTEICQGRPSSTLAVTVDCHRPEGGYSFAPTGGIADTVVGPVHARRCRARAGQAPPQRVSIPDAKTPAGCPL